MTSDGKRLEALVAYVEQLLLPEGFSVKTNEHVYNEEGVPIAEFDIEISGKIGSTEISWLIECRDRPSSGPAPGAWIEQLVGRRSRFGFNKVTAVSTTGFAAGAVEFAIAKGIEIREVNSLDPREFSDWLLIRHIEHIEKRTNLTRIVFLFDDAENIDQESFLDEINSFTEKKINFLKSSTTGELVSTADAFASAAVSINKTFDDIEVNGPPKKVNLHANYLDDDYFIIETSKGPLRVRSILFYGEISIIGTKIPLIETSEYRQTNTGELISQVASFAPQSIRGMKYSTEIHRMADTGEARITLRRLADKD